MVRIIFFFLLEKRLVFCDSVMKFVDKMTSCQFGSWKQVLTVICQKYCNLEALRSLYFFSEYVVSFAQDSPNH